MVCYWRMAARNLLQARRRTFALAAALGTVSMCMVLLMTLSQGINDNLVKAATLLISGHVNVAGFYKTRPSNAATVVTPAAPIKRLAADVLPDVKWVIDRSRGWGKLTSPQGSIEAMLWGIDIQQEAELLAFMQLAQEFEYVDGGSKQIFGDIQRLSAPHTALLFAAQAKRLGVRVGDSLTISAETIVGQQNSDDVEVVAIARDAGYLSNRNMFLPQATVRSLYQLNDDATGMVMVYLKDIARAPQAMEQLRQAMKAEGFQILPHDAQIVRKKLEMVRGEDWIGQRLDLTMWRDELGAAAWILQTLNSLTALFVSILALIVIAGIINTMWIAVRERTQEIGMLRAIGMSRPRVLILFLTEALLLGLCATALGSLLGAALAWSLNAAAVHIPVEAVQTVIMSDVLTLSVKPAQVLQTTALFTVFTALAALWPAVRAARLQPLTAIQHVG